MSHETCDIKECQRCGEISLKYVSVTDSAPIIETWECDCGHIECFHVAKPIQQMTEGWGDHVKQFYHCPCCSTRIDLDELFRLREQQYQWHTQVDQDSDWIEENG